MGENTARSSQHVSVEGRLEFIERMLADSAERHVSHDRTAVEVRSALESSNEVAEALHRELKALQAEVNGELTHESERRDALTRCLNQLDRDMQKVRGYM